MSQVSLDRRDDSPLLATGPGARGAAEILVAAGRNEG
jgi:hypothetical protein